MAAELILDASTTAHTLSVERPAASPALVVDLDGTVLKTDLFLESLLLLLKKNPLYLSLLPIWLVKGKAYLKQQVARRVEVDSSTLPYRREFLDYLQKQHDAGRHLILASAADMRVVGQVATHLKIFDRVVPTQQLASQGIDLQWNTAHLEAKPKNRVKTYLKPLRLQHWLKNLLVFVPLLAAQRLFEDALWGKAILAFVAFGCCASAGYLLNDLFDLATDRRHPDKRYRTFAAGDLPLSYAFALIPILVGLGCLLGLMISLFFLLFALIYVALSMAYSLYIRKIVLLDVIVLASFYTLRIMAGSAAVGIWPSHWLLAFSTFLFFSLALVKRYSELVIMRRIDGDHARARGYELDDGELIASMGVASGFLAVLVLALYINTDTAQAFYGRYQLIWALCPLLLYWISHIWLVAHRGKMPDDPVVFAIRDRVSLILVLLMAVTTLFAL